MDLEIIEASEYCILMFKGDVRKNQIEALRESLKKVCSNPAFKAVILDFTVAKACDDNCMTEIIVASQDLRKKGVKCFAVQLNENLKARIVQNGLSLALIPKADLDGALVEAGIKKTSRIDVDFINPFIQGALSTLKIQASIDASPEAPYLKGQGPEIRVDIVAVLGIVSTRFNGSISLCFPQEIFLMVINSMLGDSYTEINAENADAAAELLNIIFGHAKEELNKKNYGIQQAIPNVIRGNDLQLKNLMNDPTLVLPMKTAKGVFHVEITLLGA